MSPRTDLPSACRTVGLPAPHCYLGWQTQPPPHNPAASEGATTDCRQMTFYSELGLGLSCKRLERLGMTKGAWRLIRSSNESLIHKSKHFPSINLQPVKGNV